MTKTQEAYAEGLRTGKGLPILRTMDKGLSKAVSTPKEKRMIEKGYNDMLKAKKAQKKSKTFKADTYYEQADYQSALKLYKKCYAKAQRFRK